MNSNESFEILGINPNYDGNDIEKYVGNAYDNKVIELFHQKSSGLITGEAYSESIQMLKRAKEVAINALKNKTIVSTVPATVPNQTGATVATSTKSVQPEEEPEKKKGNGKKILAGCGALLVAACIAITSFCLGANYGDKDKDKNKNNSFSNIIGIFQFDDRKENDTDTKEEDRFTWQFGVDHENAYDVTEDLADLAAYGDINDERLVTERAETLVSELNAAGLFNMATNEPYTVDEIKDVIYYINGAYVPKDENDAFAMVDRYLNLAIAPLNSEEFIYAVNYHGGEDSFRPYVENNKKELKRVNFVDNLLFGDSLIAPYLHWLEDQYYAMYTTTDREKQVEIYDSVLQSLADFAFGEGFELDGKIYKENQALGTDKVNSGNMLQFMVYIIEPFRTGKSADFYQIVDPYLSANMKENVVNVPYLDIANWYAPECDYEHIEKDDEGLFLIDQNAVVEAGIEERLQDGENFATRNQINSINEMLENLFEQEQKYTK